MALKVWLTIAAESVMFAVLLFGGAGTVRWPAAWAYLVLFFASAGWLTLGLARRDPALLAERMKFPVQKGQPLWDKLLILPLLLYWCGWMFLMGADRGRLRFGTMPICLQWVGGAFMLHSFAMFDRVFRENTFLSAVVRIQTDRGHRVISTGPYAIVRHPLYAAALIHIPATAFLLGSWLGLAASAVVVAALIFRTAMEDRELHHRLPEYAAYAGQVRYRLLPFVW